MARRKVTKADVQQAYDMANDAKKSALFSLKRARQLKDGADKLHREYKENAQNAKKGTAKKSTTSKKSPAAKKTTTTKPAAKKPVAKKPATKKAPAQNNTPWWAREEGE